MQRFLALLILLLPVSAGAATLRAGDTLTLTSAPPGNAYLAGSEVRVSVPVPGDLVAAAGSVQIFSPVEDDVLIAGGTIELAAPVAGDVRAAGGRIHVGQAVAGELAAFSGRLIVTGEVHEVRAAGGIIELRSGAAGPVEVYGTSVLLAGEFAGDVFVVASDQVTLAEGTVIRGTLQYNAPQEASIPATALIEGGTRYTGSSAFLPTAEEAKTFALAGIGIFFLVRLVAAMLVAGLVTGLFPAFARRIVHEAAGRSVRRFLLLGLLGFAFLVATPILVVLLLASFVGIGIAALIGAGYVLLVMLGYLYAAVIAGSLFARFVLKRTGVSWRSAAFGMLMLYVLGLIPVFGFSVSFVLTVVAMGALIATFFRFAFGGSGSE